MKKITMLIVCGAWIGLTGGCSKKDGPNPEDTSLIKGDDRGNFTDGTGNLVGDDFANGGETINADLGDGLVLQDSSWGDPNALADAERPFDPIYFGFDQYGVGREERSKLQQVAEYLQINRDARILIEGYCDWKGTPEYNKSLGDRRASSVKNYLVDLGCDSLRIEVVSIGDEKATPNASSTQARMDRCAQFLVLKGS